MHRKRAWIWGEDCTKKAHAVLPRHSNALCLKLSRTQLKTGGCFPGKPTFGEKDNAATLSRPPFCGAAVLAFGLTGCGEKKAPEAPKAVTLTVGATPVPHADILNSIEPTLKKRASI
ncbi:MAG: hypothetical protein V8R49_06140 [Duodenibacillus massiliensis]